MNIEFWGVTMDVIGKLMISYTAVKVHYRFWKEHQIDDAVFNEMRSEYVVGVIGIIFIVVGYFLQVPSLLS